MDYAKILNRAFDIVWHHKYLILLGVLVALGNNSSGGQISWRMNGNDNGVGRPGLDIDIADFPNIDGAFLSNVALPAIIVGVFILIAIAVAVWVVSLIGRGGLIASVDTLASGGLSSFSHAWTVGKSRINHLIVIGLAPAIPILVFLVVLVIGAGSFGGPRSIITGQVDAPLIAGISMVVILAACIAVPLTIGLVLMRTFAERACIIEGLSPYDAYRRGWEVVMTNIGDAIVLFVLQVAIGIGLLAALFVPGLVLALCFFTWPILMLLFGTVAAFFSTVWTLAWREWTGVETLSTFPRGDRPVPQGL